MNSGEDDPCGPGFPIRKSTDQSLFGSSPWLIAACNVLHRLLAPRHPPIALTNLTEFDARARYAVLKDQSPGIRTTAPSIYSASCRRGPRVPRVLPRN